MTQKHANIALCIIFIVASCWFIYTAQGFSDNSLLGTSELSSRFFPNVIFSVIILFCGLLIAEYLFRPMEEEADDAVWTSWVEVRRVLLVLIVTVVAYYIWRYVGFLVMAMAIGPAIAAAMAVRSPLVYLILFAFGPAVYFIFKNLLGIQLG